MKIEQVELYITRYEETVYFYEHVLGFRLKFWTDEAAAFQIGDSILKLIKDGEENHFYYHFAFNIHANKFKDAKKWLKERVVLLTEDGEDEIVFEGRNRATSCYFEDPAGNIVEFIAREKIAPLSNTLGFTTKNVLSISEISLSTDDIGAAYKGLQALGISARDNETYLHTDLNFIGSDEDGAYILLGPVGRRWLFSKKVAIPSPVIIHTNLGELKWPITE